MKNSMNRWVIANQKGGVGKTTTAVSLAGLLARRGEPTLIVDLDPHGSMSSYFGLDPEAGQGSVYDLFSAAAAGKQPDMASVIQTTAFEHLSIMPASTALATLEKQLGGRNGMGLVLGRSLQMIDDHYRHVLIDCPPILGMLMVNALAACDELLIPVQTEHLAIKGLDRMLRTLSMIERSMKMNIDYTILPTLFDRRTMASVQSLERLRELHSGHLFHSPIPVDTKFRDASHAGKPLSHMHPNTHGLRAYEQFLDSLLPDTSQPQQVAV